MLLRKAEQLDDYEQVHQAGKSLESLILILLLIGVKRL